MTPNGTLTPNRTPLKLKIGLVPANSGLGSSNLNMGSTAAGAAVKSSPPLTSSKGASTPVSTPKNPPFRSLYGEIVHIKVGPERADFGIHKGLLCHLSKFFQASLNGSFAEASTGVVELPEENSAVFEIFNTWLYTKQITQAKGGENTACNQEQLVNLFILGDKLSIPDLCNSVIDLVIERFEKKGVVFSKSLARIYNTLPPNSPLRRLVLATYVQHTYSTVFVERMGEHTDRYLACPEFLLDLTRALLTDRIPTFSPHRITDPCQYHQHAEGEAKCT